MQYFIKSVSILALMSGAFATSAMEEDWVNERPWLDTSAKRQNMDRGTYLEIRSILPSDDKAVWEIQEEEDRIHWLTQNPAKPGAKAREFIATRNYMNRTEPQLDSEMEARVERIQRDEPWLIGLAQSQGYTDFRDALAIRDLLSEDDRKEVLQLERQAEAQWKLTH